MIELEILMYYATQLILSNKLDFLILEVKYIKCLVAPKNFKKKIDGEKHVNKILTEMLGF